MYVERLKVEGDWIWSRFKIYMTLNTGIFAAIGLLVRDLTFDFSSGDIAKLAIISGASLLGWQIAIQWLNVNVQGRFWENVFTWHAAQIEKKINMESIDLYQYIDSFEQSDGYKTKPGMEHIISQMKGVRNDPILSNQRVSKAFMWVFVLSFVASTSAFILAAIIAVCTT